MKSPRLLSRLIPLLAVLGLFALPLILPAQQPPAPGAGGAPSQSGQAGRGGGRGVAMTPPAPDDLAGFTALFDGKTLTNWDGDPRFWRVENGVLVGQSTPENVVNPNSFLIWRGGILKNFELKIDYRFTSGEAGNSGVQYRSKEMPEVGKWVLAGYQADMDPIHRNTGLLYEERGRGFASRPGTITRRVEGGAAKLIGSTGELDAIKAAAMKPSGEWHTYHIIAKENVITQILNGRIINMLIDDEPEKRAMEGLLGLQIHQGPPMQIEFRNIYLKTLP